MNRKHPKESHPFCNQLSHNIRPDGSCKWCEEQFAKRLVLTTEREAVRDKAKTAIWDSLIRQNVKMEQAAPRLIYETGFELGFYENETWIQQMEGICRKQGHLYLNAEGTGRRIFWTEAGWELEPHTYDDFCFTFPTVLEAFAKVTDQGEPTDELVREYKEAN